jgi:hypothetical protein
VIRLKGPKSPQHPKFELLRFIVNATWVGGREIKNKTLAFQIQLVKIRKAHSHASPQSAVKDMVADKLPIRHEITSTGK